MDIQIATCPEQTITYVEKVSLTIFYVVHPCQTTIEAET